MLIRPDGHVCWVDTRPDSSPLSVLQRWFGHTPIRAV
ncbi:MAG: hypothetical protein ACRDRO_13685 [Pseudonocardiaceae bacterium]